MSYEIKTGNYVKPLKINLDGNEWTMTSPGAGTEIRMGQIQRRITILDKKIADGTANDDDLDKYDEYEKQSFEYLLKIFSDSTPDNLNVKKWLESIPLGVANQIISDIAKQAIEKKAISEPTEPAIG